MGKYDDDDDCQSVINLKLRPQKFKELFGWESLGPCVVLIFDGDIVIIRTTKVVTRGKVLFC